MKLYVMRHGSAEDDSADGRDATRALTAGGRERVREVARKLVAEGEAPRVIVSSPLVRALQTAEIVHAHTKVDSALEVQTAIAPHGDALTFVRDAARAGRKRMMVVGHEPDLSILVSSLVGRPMSSTFMKAMVVALRLPQDGGDALIRFVLDPKTLELTDHRSTISHPPHTPHT
jgi:phosphohistidine phosphatase